MREESGTIEQSSRREILLLRPVGTLVTIGKASVIVNRRSWQLRCPINAVEIYTLKSISTLGTRVLYKTNFTILSRANQSTASVEANLRADNNSSCSSFSNNFNLYKKVLSLSTGFAYSAALRLVLLERRTLLAQKLCHYDVAH